MPKIKLFAAIPRSPEISRQEFHDHWRHPHGTWSCLVSPMRRYVQSHRIDSDLLGEDQMRIEGVAECWMDSEQDLFAVSGHPVFVEKVLPDESLFIDRSKLRHVATSEDVISSGPVEAGAGGVPAWDEATRPTSVKVIQFVEEEREGGVAAGSDPALGIALGALREVRCTALKLGDEEPPFLGVRELWWPTLSDLNAGVSAAPDAWRAWVGQPARGLTIIAQAERFK